MFDIFERWLRLGAARLHAAAAELTALDQAIGDGDHGINMDRGFTAIVAQLDAGRPEADGDRALTGTAAKAAGKTLISTVGGAAGPLYGTAFIRGGTSILTGEPDRSAGSVLVTALHQDDARCADARPYGGPGCGGGRWRHLGRGACHGGRGRDRCGCHRADARDQGPGVVPRRAERRSSGPWGHVGGAVVARPGRCRGSGLID